MEAEIERTRLEPRTGRSMAIDWLHHTVVAPRIR